MKLANSTVLVTGANRGLGRALVTAALERGARRVYAGARTLASLTDLPERVVPLQLDLTDPRSLAAAAERASDVTLLINNAGVLVSSGVLASAPEQIAQEFATNVIGTLAVSRAFAPGLPHGSAIVNVLSVVSLANMPGLGVYSAAKAASYSLTQALRADLAPRGIRVHAAFPGAIDTDMVRTMEMPKTSPADVAAAILVGLEAGLDDIVPDPMGRELYAMWQRDPDELARALANMGG